MVGLRVSGFGFRVSGVGFRVLAFGWPVPGFWLRFGGFGWAVSASGVPKNGTPGPILSPSKPVHKREFYIEVYLRVKFILALFRGLGIDRRRRTTARSMLMALIAK